MTHPKDRNEPKDDPRGKSAADRERDRDDGTHTVPPAKATQPAKAAPVPDPRDSDRSSAGTGRIRVTNGKAVKATRVMIHQERTRTNVVDEAVEIEPGESKVFGGGTVPAAGPAGSTTVLRAGTYVVSAEFEDGSKSPTSPTPNAVTVSDDRQTEVRI